MLPIPLGRRAYIGSFVTKLRRISASPSLPRVFLRVKNTTDHSREVCRKVLCNSHPVLWMLLDSGNSRRFLQLTSLRPSMGVKKDRGVRPSYTRPVVVSAFSISSRARDFCQQARVHWHSPHFFACPSGTGRSIVCIFFLTRKKKKRREEGATGFFPPFPVSLFGIRNAV